MHTPGVNAGDWTDGRLAGEVAERRLRRRRWGEALQGNAVSALHGATASRRRQRRSSRIRPSPGATHGATHHGGHSGVVGPSIHRRPRNRRPTRSRRRRQSPVSSVPRSTVDRGIDGPPARVVEGNRRCRSPLQGRARRKQGVAQGLSEAEPWGTSADPSNHRPPRNRRPRNRRRWTVRRRIGVGRPCRSPTASTLRIPGI